MNDARAVWDAEAERFDLEPDHGLADPETRSAWRDLLLPLVPASESDVVDIGCGTGSLALLFAEAGHRVRGLDVSPRMIELARSKAAKAGVELDLTVGDAAEPPYDARSCDLVVVRHVLWALDDPAAVVGRWARLLRPSGTLALVEGSWHTGTGLRAAQVERFVSEHRSRVEVIDLSDRPVLWGGVVGDERFLVVGRDQ